jgi:hypothetical protein
MKKKSPDAKRTANAGTSREDPLPVWGDGAASPGAGVARKVAHLTPGERVARGKAARNEVPRSSHDRWEPAANRPDPVALLEERISGPRLRDGVRVHWVIYPLRVMRCLKHRVHDVTTYRQ